MSWSEDVLKIVFMGTPEFAVPSLEILINSGYEILAVVTQPDKPKGRGKKLSPPPVKEHALLNSIKVLQPDKIKTEEFLNEIKELKPDLLVTCAYGKILSKELLEVPPLGCINVHGSLLPKYRGAAPIHWCIINGEKTTGITTMYTDIGMDTGDMLLKRELEITDDMTVGDLHDKMSVLGAEVLLDTLKSLENGTLIRIPQNNDEATYVSIIKKDIGKIDWNKTTNEIHNLVRGTNPWPGAYCEYQGDKMRLWNTKYIEVCDIGLSSDNDNIEESNIRPGMILNAGKDGITVKTGDGILLVTEVQFANCRRMCVEEYICGHEIIEGEILE